MRPSSAAIMVLLAAAILSGGCSAQRDRPDTFGDRSPLQMKEDIAAVKADIAELSKGKNTEDIEGTAAYDQAREKLIRRGSAIEPQVIEALRGSNDWGVRLGAVEVLQAIGTKTSVEHLIVATDDDQPLVAFHADQTLRAMLDHSVIPAASRPAEAAGTGPSPKAESSASKPAAKVEPGGVGAKPALPGTPTATTGAAPIALPPVPPATDTDSEAELRVWSAWHAEYRHNLKSAWEAWWKANRATVKMK